jgi:hypothetical protein
MGNAKKLARRLLKQNRGTRSIPARSWRVIARDDYQNKIPAGTLCTFAKRDGDWLPTMDHQITLGLRKERKHKAEQPLKPISEMATSALREALINRQPMPPLDPRVMRAFEKVGWIKKQKPSMRSAAQ